MSNLEKILGDRPNFRFFSDTLTKGMDCCFTEEVSEEQQQAEVTAIMERGNHQSIQEDSKAAVARKLLAKDVPQGFLLQPGTCSQLSNRQELRSSFHSKRMD